MGSATDGVIDREMATRHSFHTGMAANGRIRVSIAWRPLRTH